MEDKHSVPFETGKEDPFFYEMLEDFAVGRWMDAHTDMSVAVAERYTFRELFVKMTKDRLVDTGLMLNEETEDMPIWGADDQPREWPGVTALRSMKKDALVSYLASAYERVLLFLLLQLDFPDIVRLMQIADEDRATLIAIVPEAVEAVASKEGRVDLGEKYSDLICDGLLVPQHLCRFSNILFYGLYLPEEVRTLIREHSAELLIERMLLDIVDCYARAAVNLYGVIVMDELPKIIQKYESRIAKDGVTRGAVTELDSLISDTKREGLERFRDLTDRRKDIANMLSRMSAEELMAHVETVIGGYEDYELIPLELDGKEMVALVSGDLMERTENAEALSDAVIDLLDSQKGKPRYFPATYERFMEYSQGIVNNDVPATTHLKRLSSWLEKKHGQEIAGLIRQGLEDQSSAVLHQKYEDDGADNVARAANEIVLDLYTEIVCGTGNPTKDGMGLKTLDTRYDLIMRSINEANEYLTLWREINSNSRMFSNNGNTPLEIKAQMPPHEGPTKLIFGPGMQGTDMPLEIKKVIQAGAFARRLQVDDDEVKRASKKVGRNDPCPCGSGKKFKHCCGKNQ